ncbi:MULTISPECIES: hypothetical protein [Micromonospora]|uniref:hypothetical protein n=1 Tax=Micromonospora TaxID=1873 RepID=UPI0011CE4249|nr:MULTISPECIES: hypothetical protein [Micromonospora]NES17134.1 hypothetical protein [Micromonospora sp. PPF5-17B]NES38990.1 hypothetical protein [Micromonospora solifontis]NES58889.1 hypothetical protein [Micromonospora sp. PPF5-6]
MRRSKSSPVAGVRFCDSRAEVITTEQRVHRIYDAARNARYATYGRFKRRAELLDATLLERRNPT